MTSLPSDYRPDINGLRAWAVLSVILFHFELYPFSGGFVGVDIFFVISGYLMTKIIISAQELHSFSLTQFYLARARRIIPALLFLCITLMILGWFWLTSLDYKKLGNHISGAALFYSNFQLASETGYFDSSAEEKWMLHTWSLSLEWQYYLLYPMLLIALNYLRFTKWLARVLITIALSSFVLALIGALYWPTMTFFMLPTRAWELVVGGLAWVIGRKLKFNDLAANYFEKIGFSFIFISLLFFDRQMAWPSIYSALPVCGAALIIVSNRNSSWLTTTKAMTWIGDRSYSIYLWHWPAAVLLTYLDLKHQVSLSIIAIAASLVVGHISFRFIEKPCRSMLKNRPTTYMTALGSATVATSLIAFIASSVEIPGRTPAAVEAIIAQSSNKNPRIYECALIPGSNTESPHCIFGEGDVHAIVFGDSHATTLTTAVAEALHLKGAAMEISYMGCPTLLGAERISGPHRCSEFNKKQVAWLNQNLEGVPVILASRYALYMHGERAITGESKPTIYFGDRSNVDMASFMKEFENDFTMTTCALRATHPVYLVRPLPEMSVNVPSTMSRALMFQQVKQDIAIHIDAYKLRQTEIWKIQDRVAQRCGAEVLNPLPYLCDLDRCLGSKNGMPLYYDDDHLSELGNKLLVPMFLSALM